MSGFKNQKQQSLPLLGIKVVDFGRTTAGQATSMILGDLGATVIRIGTDEKIPVNATLNRNKCCVDLDLRNPQQVQKALNIIKLSDVVIDSFCPGHMKSIGIDYEALRKERPELITMSIPGFASNDSDLRDKKTTEAIVLAAAGAFTDMGFNRILMGFNPSFSPLPLASSYTTSLAASAIVMSLFARLQTGIGDSVEVPMICATMEGLSYNSIVVSGITDRYKCLRQQEIESRLESGKPMDVKYEQLHEYLDPFYRTYTCGDGRQIYIVLPAHHNHVTRILKLTGLHQQLMDEGFPNLPAVGLHTHSRNLTELANVGMYPINRKWARHIAPRMEAAFLTKSAFEWFELFGEWGIPATPHLRHSEWINDAHNRTAGLIVQQQNPDFGEMLMPGSAVWCEEFSADLSKPPRPTRHMQYEETLALLRDLQHHPEIVTQPNFSVTTSQRELPGSVWCRSDKA